MAAFLPNMMGFPADTTAPITDSVTILGAGVWGSALAELGRANGHRVRVWSRRSDLALEEAVAQVPIILVAMSMQGVRALSDRLRDMPLLPNAIWVSATKGLEPQTWQTPSQIWSATFPNHAIAVLSGPNLSQEIGQGLPAATVVASEDGRAATRVQQLFASEKFRVYTNTDRLGTELGGTLKNVVAIAVGVCDGLHLGQNARAALITRALPEIIRVGTLMGGQVETFYGLSGLGDLLATCTSPLSRNYQVGYQLAQGKSLTEILSTLKGTAEGINTTHVLMELAQNKQISLPIAQQVYGLLNGNITPTAAVEALMERELKPEASNNS